MMAITIKEKHLSYFFERAEVAVCIYIYIGKTETGANCSEKRTNTVQLHFFVIIVNKEIRTGKFIYKLQISFNIDMRLPPWYIHSL